MGKDNDYKWYIIHTYSGLEEKVRDAIFQRAEAMGLSEYFKEIKIPSETYIEVSGKQKKEVKRKLFPGYVLVKMKMTNESWFVVRSTPRVTGFVGSGKTPIPLREEEVIPILEMSKRTKEAPKAKVFFKRGDQVRIVSGPFASFIGVVDEIDEEREKVKVLVTIFGRQTPVELKFHQVEEEK